MPTDSLPPNRSLHSVRASKSPEGKSEPGPTPLALVPEEGGTAMTDLEQPHFLIFRRVCGRFDSGEERAAPLRLALDEFYSVRIRIADKTDARAAFAHLVGRSVGLDSML